MGGVKMCDKRCHQAKGKRCACWCKGAFHGMAGLQARLDYFSEFRTVVPPTEEEYNAVVRSRARGVVSDGARPA